MTDRKKIFDIAPPVLPHDSKEAQPVEPKPSLTRPKSSQTRSEPIKKPIFNKKLIPVFAALVLLLAFLLSYFLIPPKAQVEIWPKKERIEEVTTFVARDVLEAEKIVSGNFEVQGKKLKATKAQGLIRVYNNYSTSPQVLIATTRFVSNDGKLFRTTKRVTVPGGRYEGGKLTAGFIDVEVMADQSGEDYNIDESTFSIPGFAGTSKYTAFYAKSFAPLTGGLNKEVSFLTQQDLDNAKETLNRTALAEAEANIRDSIVSGGYTLIDNKAILVKVLDFKSSAELGQEIASFSAQVKAAAKAIVFKEQGLRDFAGGYIQSKLRPEQKLIERFLKTEYSLEIADLEKNQLVLKISISARTHSLPDELLIKEMIKNKSLEQVKNVLRGLGQVEKAVVEFQPFWVSLSPEDLDNIEVLIRLD